MPETERTHWDVPIPLRDNDSPGTTPNPYSRLEACEAVRKRIETLADELQEAEGAAWTIPAAAVRELLAELDSDLRLAVWGTLGDVDRVSIGRPLGLWLRRWRARIWAS